MKVFVKTPSRLHFTLIDLHGGLGRVDGGIGVAIQTPGFTLEANPSKSLRVEGMKRRLVTPIIDRLVKGLGINPKMKIHFKETTPLHLGLGSSTQLALGLAAALCKLSGVSMGARDLATITGRGGTSGVGVAAFEGGGFILDGGHSFGVKGAKSDFLPSHASNAHPAPLLARYPLPEDWFFVVAIPGVGMGRHGAQEVEAFKKHCPTPAPEVERVSRTILMKILPSIVEKDIVSFGQGLSEIQGMGFKRVEVEFQHPLVKSTMDFMIKNGACGAGMSSFGPAVYGVVKGLKRAQNVATSTKGFLEETVGGQCFCTTPRNVGADVQVIDEEGQGEIKPP